VQVSGFQNAQDVYRFKVGIEFECII
jgi:hypothetical protein